MNDEWPLHVFDALYKCTIQCIMYIRTVIFFCKAWCEIKICKNQYNFRILQEGKHVGTLNFFCKLMSS